MELKMIPVNDIHTNPSQPRESFAKETLQGLSESMRDAGVIQPVVVRPHGRGYQLIAGERRWRAAQLAGLEKIPCIVKEIGEERVLVESLIENLHRKDLTDFERESAIHELWESRERYGFETRAELARAIGLREDQITNDIDAWEFRRMEKSAMGASTRVIRGTRGLKPEERKKIIDKVKTGEIRASEVDTAAKIVRRASETVKRELLRPKSRITPKMAETILLKLPSEEEQNIVVDEIKKFRLTEDEVEDRVREIQRDKEAGKPLTKEMGVKEGVTYTIGEYECPHCKRHYLIKCDGKRDWVE